jgi:hypothetical protein
VLADRRWRRDQEAHASRRRLSGAAAGGWGEPHTPTIAPAVPTILWTLGQLLGCEPFSKRKKARLHQTEQPNALPASWRCPGQPGVLSEAISLSTPGSPSVLAATVPAMSSTVISAACCAVNGILCQTQSSAGSEPSFAKLRALRLLFLTENPYPAPREITAQLTRAALSTCGRAKSNLSVFPLETPPGGHLSWRPNL